MYASPSETISSLVLVIFFTPLFVENEECLLDLGLNSGWALV